MSKAGVSFNSIKEEMLQDKTLKMEYDKLESRYQMVETIIAARKEQNLTQAELARRIGTQKSNISRLESGNYNPSFDMLVKIAKALGKQLNIQIY